MNDLGSSWPYFTLFITSFLGGVTPFGMLFYLGGLTYAGLVLDLNPFVVIVLVSLGVTLGKTILLALCRKLRRTSFIHKRTQHASFLHFISRRGWLIAILVSATPIPDEFAVVPLGLTGYATWRYALPTFIGKCLQTGLILWGVGAAKGPLSNLVQFT